MIKINKIIIGSNVSSCLQHKCKCKCEALVMATLINAMQIPSPILAIFIPSPHSQHNPQTKQKHWTYPTMLTHHVASVKTCLNLKL